MHDEVTIILVLGVLYLSDTILWLPVRAVAIVRGFRGWHLSYPSKILGNEKGGLVFINPLMLPLYPPYVFRLDRVEQKKDLFNVRDIKKKIRKLKQETYFLSVLCSCLLIYVIIVIPIVLLSWGLLRSFIPLGVVLYSSAVLVAIIFFRIHRKLIPNQKWERVNAIVRMIVCPPVAITAGETLTLRIFQSHHPLAICSVLGGQNMLVEFSEKMLTHSDHRLEINMQMNNLNLSKKLIKFLQHQRIEVLDILKQPTSIDEGAVSYCPNCLCQYIYQEGTCPDCFGVSLLPLEKKISND